MILPEMEPAVQLVERRYINYDILALVIVRVIVVIAVAITVIVIVILQLDSVAA
jgi:hypothetical protein